MRTMPDLSSLKLSWLSPHGGRGVHLINFSHPSNGGGLPTVHLRRYREVPAGVMLRVVQQAPALTHFGLLHVREAEQLLEQRPDTKKMDKMIPQSCCSLPLVKPTPCVLHFTHPRRSGLHSRL